MKNVFKAKKGQRTCNQCDIYMRCVELEKSGGAKHNGARACKYFYENKDLFVSVENR